MSLTDEFSSSTVLLGDCTNLLQSLPASRFALVVTSPPYNIGKSYEKDSFRNYKHYEQFTAEVAKELDRVLIGNGSICWQVGNHVRNSEITPLDFLAFNVFSSLGYKLRSRIVWTFNFGLHGSRRFSGRYEVLLWFTKNDSYKFNLDPVRVPQKYPGKRHSSKKAAGQAGKLSGNPLGKNPGDFWEFDASAAFFDKPIWRLPNVKANHPEKTAHPCQFPVEVAERCILALTSEGDSILDPFAGVGSSMLAAEKHSRIGIGIEKEASYQKLAMDRLEQLRAGTLPLRPSGKPVAEPDGRAKVATYPLEWMNAEGKG